MFFIRNIFKVQENTLLKGGKILFFLKIKKINKWMIFPKHRVIILNNHNLYNDQYNRYYDFFHNWAVLGSMRLMYFCILERFHYPVHLCVKELSLNKSSSSSRFLWKVRSLVTFKFYIKCHFLWSLAAEFYLESWDEPWVCLSAGMDFSLVPLTVYT